MRKLFACRLAAWLLFLSLGPRTGHAQTPTWTWITNPPVRNGTVFNTVMTADAAGYVYVAGSFTGSITLGIFTLTAPSAAVSEVFVVKINSGGTPVWAQQGGGATPNKRCTAIAVNATGEVALTGYFAAPTAGFGTFTLTSRGNSDAFVAKLTPAGAWRWAVAGGGTTVDRGYGVAVNNAGEVYAAGDFESPTATFGTTVLTNGSTGGTANGFVTKLSPTGTWVWAKSSTVSASTDLRTHALTTDATGNVYVGGALRGTVSFGSITLTPVNPAATTLFIARLSATGVWQRAVTTGGPGTSSVAALATDAAGYVYATGHFGGPVGASVTFGPASLVTAGGIFNAFVARLDVAGAWQWATPAGGADYDYGTGLVVDPGGTVLVKGTFQSPTATFGATTLTNSHGATPGADGFLAYLLPAGTWRRAIGFVGSTTNDGGLAVTANHFVTLTGSFTGPTAPLGPATLTNLGTDGRGFYFAQLDVGPLATPPLLTEPAFTLWPNPASETVQVAGAPGTVATLFDGLGRPALTVPLPTGEATLDLRALPAGVYQVVLTDPGGHRRTGRVVRE